MDLNWVRRWSWIAVLTLALGCNSSRDSEDSAPVSDAADGAAMTEDDLMFDGLPDVDESEPESTEVDSAQAVRAEQQQFKDRLNQAIGAGDMPQAVSILEEARGRFPNDADIAISLLAMRLQQDDALTAGDMTAAAASFRTTADLAHELFDGQQIPDNMRRLWTASLFNEARALAHAGDSDAARTAVDQLFQSGFTQYRKLRSDPFLVSLQEDAAFQGVVQRYQQQIEQQLREEARQELAEAESYAFDFELPDLDEQPVKLANYAGKIVIVDIWGTWCPPCRMEIPHFIELRDTYGDDLEIVGINYENGSPEEVLQTIRDFVEEQGVNYTCVIGDQDTQDQIPEFRGFPTTLLLDREGKVRLTLVGYHPYEKLEAIVTELIHEGRSET